MDSTCWNILVTINRMVPARFAVYPNENRPQRKGEKDESDLCRAFIHHIERVCVAGVKKEICHDVCLALRGQRST